MALVVNKYVSDEDVFNNKYYRGVNVTVTIGNAMSSAWILLNDSPLINTNKVWFGTSTSSFQGYFTRRSKSKDDDGNIVYKFNLLSSRITRRFAAAQGDESRLHSVVDREGIYGETSRRAWEDITNKDSGCDLYIEDKEELLRLVSEPAPKSPCTPKCRRHIAYYPDDLEGPYGTEHERDIKYARWLLDHSGYKRHPYMDKQLDQDYIQERSLVRAWYYGIPEMVEAKKNGYILLRVLEDNTDAADVLSEYPTSGGKIVLIDPSE